MKRIYFFLLIFIGVMTFVAPVSLSAKVTDTREIELQTKAGNKELRSVLPVRAWVDNRVVHVFFLDLPTEATVSISDTEGNLIDVCSYQSPSEVSIPIEEGNGKFEIEISYGDNLFVGNFVLD